MSRHVSDHLSAYLDGDLGVRDVERVRAHLNVCPACLQEYQGIQRVQRLLRGLRDPAPRLGFLERVHWRLGREAARLPHARRAGWPLAGFHASPVRLVLAATALLLVLGSPVAWWSGHFAGRGEAPLDTDVYLRHYLTLSADPSLADEAAITFVSSDTGAPDQPNP